MNNDRQTDVYFLFCSTSQLTQLHKKSCKSIVNNKVINGQTRPGSTLTLGYLMRVKTCCNKKFGNFMKNCCKHIDN